MDIPIDRFLLLSNEDPIMYGIGPIPIPYETTNAMTRNMDPGARKTYLDWNQDKIDRLESQIRHSRFWQSKQVE